MIRYVIYEKSTGRITSLGKTDSERSARLQLIRPELDIIFSDDVGLDQSIHYVRDEAIALRPVLDVPARIELRVGEEISFVVPPSCALTDHLSVEHLIEDGELVLEGDVASHYRIVLNAWPYRTHEVEVTVNEA